MAQELEISSEFLNTLEKADKKLKKLNETTDQLESTFSSLVNGGLTAFSQKLGEITNAIGNISKAKIGDLGIEKVTNDATKAADAVNTVVEAVDKIVVGDKTYSNSALNKINEEIQKTANELNELQKSFNFLTTGEGQSSLGLTSGKPLKKEANDLMGYIGILDSLEKDIKDKKTYLELLEEERRQIISNSQERIKADQVQSEIEKYKKARAKRANAEAKKSISDYQEELKRAERETRETREKLFALSEKNFPKNATYEGAMIYSKSTQSIAEQITAIKALKNAREKLNKSNLGEQEYNRQVKDLTDEINRQQKEVDRLTGKYQQLGNTHKSMIHTGEQLKRALTGMFSVSAISRYVKKLTQVRGEFELQQRALQAILQNKDEADKLWDKTVQLAIRSPFQIKELVTYTKQLAAYRIEADKLYDTNKMLADISAGLGVDMQRLILVFGQVKSANYLKGTELRQFFEAGINILGELAKYFTELEGRAVSVGNVFERVSKRMVSFADVEEVLKRVTSEGGVFYNMQEIQAETLKGQISNLKDSIDVMLNEIGEDSEGVIKGVVGAVKFLIDNYEILVNIVKAGLPMFIAWQLALSRTNEKLRLLGVDLGVLTNDIPDTVSLTQLLEIRFKSLGKTLGKLGKTLTKNPYIIGLTLALITIGKLIEDVGKYNREIDKINKDLAETQRRAEGISVKFTVAGEQGDVSEQRKQLNQLISLAENEHNIKFNVEIANISDEELDEVFTDLRNKIEQANIFSGLFAKQLAKETRLVWFQDDVKEDLEDLGGSATEYYNQLVYNAQNYAYELQELKRKEGELSEEMQQFLSIFTTPRRVDESEIDYLEKLDTASKKYLFSTRGNLKAAFTGEHHRWFIDLQEARKEWNDFLANLDVNRNLPKEKLTLELNTAINKAVSENNWNTFVEQYVRKWTETEFELKFTPVVEGAQNKTLSAWQEAYNNFADTLSDSMSLKIKSSEDDENKMRQMLSGVITSNETFMKAYEKSNATYKKLRKDEYERIKRETNSAKALLSWLGGDAKSTEADKLFDSRLKVIKEIKQEYERLNQTVDDTVAREGAIAKFGQAFKSAFGKTPEDMGFDLFSEEGMKSALDWLIKTAPSQAKKIQAELAKGDIIWEVKLETKKQDDEKLFKSIDKMFDQYELSLNLEKLGVPKDLAKDIFGIEMTDLKQIRQLVEKNIDPSTGKALFSGKDAEKKRQAYLDKIDNMESKAAEQRIKKYVQYLATAQSQRVKIEMDTLRQIKEVNEEANFSDAQKATIIAKIRQEAQKEIDKVQWEDFKNSEFYTLMFEDLESLGDQSIELLRKQLEDLRGSLSHLDASEVKEIMSQLQKLKDLEIERDPFASLRVSREEVDVLKEKGLTQEKLNEDLLENTQNQRNNQEVIDAMQLALNSKREEGIMLEGESLNYAKKTEKELEDGIEALTLQNETLKDSQKTITENLQKYRNYYNSVQGSMERTKDYLDQTNSILSGTVALMDALGVPAEDVSREIVDIGMNLVSAAQSAIQFHQQMLMVGYASNMALGVIGWIAIGIQTIASLIQTIANYNQGRLNAQIEKHQKNIDDLQKSYDKLEKSMDEAYNIEQLQKYNQEMKNNLQLQLENAKAAKAAAEAGKDNKENQEKAEQYQDIIDEITTSMDELDKSTKEALSGGTFDSILSDAEAFVDAWLGAFEETGDGLSGLEEQFQDTLKNIVKRQVALQFVGNYVKGWSDTLNSMFASGGELTPEEISDYAEKIKSEFPELSERLEEFFKALGSTLDGTGSLSGLEKGFQGITEATAEVIASFLNSLRFYVADTNSRVANVERLIGGNEENNPMLEQLKIIAAQTQAIHDLLRSVATPDGKYIKVELKES